MKTLILGDVHLGVKNGNARFLDYHRSFFFDYLFPYIKENNIEIVIILGDFLDKRQSIDFMTAKIAIEIINWFIQEEIYLIDIVGNHDLALRNSTEVSGIAQYAEMINSVYFDVITKPTKIVGYDDEKYPGPNLIAIPWITPENKERCMKFIRKNANENSILLGHFEMAGFPMLKNFIAPEGNVDPTELSDYHLVLSGHYHVQSCKKNIQYLGSATELTWNDYNVSKMFMVIDTDQETGMVHIDYVPSKFPKMFYVLQYPEFANQTDYVLYAEGMIPQKSYIKVKVNEVDDFLDEFVSKIQNAVHPEDLRVILPDQEGEEELPENVSIESPLEIMEFYINQMNVDNDSKRYIMQQAIEIFNEAQEKLKESQTL